MPAPATSVTAHHSLAPALPATASVEVERNAVAAIHRHHAAKWAGIGYNFVITQRGTVLEGRGWMRVGAHAGTTTGNRTSVGVCFLIDGRRDPPSAAALAAFWDLRAEGVRLGFLTPGHELKLHRDWKATECPGAIAAAAIMLTRAFAPAPVALPPTVLRRGDRGPVTEALQELLVATGYMTAAQMATGPGVHGPQTAAAFAAFLAAHR
jgi:hypothetical protein